MTRFIHDQFAKDYLAQLLSPIGEVKTSQDVASEVRQIDVLFTPATLIASYIKKLGLLGKLATTPAVFEPFRNAVTPQQIRSCMGKVFDIHAEWERLAKRERRRITSAELPRLWILTPTASPALLDSFDFRGINRKGYPLGVYVLGAGLFTGLVAIHQLPRTQETIWLRMLGKGGVQQEAIKELAGLAVDDRLRDSALELLYDLQANLSANRELEVEDRELIMALAPLYRQQIEAAREEGIEQGIERGIQRGIEQGIQRGIERGIERGRQEENRAILENLLRMRFGELDEIFTVFLTPVSALSAVDFTRLLVELSTLIVDDNGVKEAQGLLARSVLKMRFGELDELLGNMIPGLVGLSPENLGLLLSELPQLSVDELLVRVEGAI